MSSATVNPMLSGTASPPGFARLAVPSTINVLTPRPPIAPLPPLASGTGIDSVAYGDRLIGRPALAHWLGISATRLARWARDGHGPTPRRPGGVKVQYRIGDVLDFIEAARADMHPDVRRKARKPKTENLTQV
jgi:hypothetical protein